MGNRHRMTLGTLLIFLPLACLAISSPLRNQASDSAASLKTVLNMTAEELSSNYPELADVEFDPDQTQLDSILRKVGERVETFFREFSNTSARESVLMERFGTDGRVEASTRQEFNYMILVNSQQKLINFQEDRADNKGRSVNPKITAGYILTSGYAGLCLVLHPSHHFGSGFRYLGRQTSNPSAQVIAFAQKPQVGDYLSAYTNKENMITTQLLMQGIVWVDPVSYQILRIRTELLYPDILASLMRQGTDIRFSEVHFDAVPQSFWLPRDVTVTWKLSGRSYRNQHRYSDYKVFTVESYDKVGQPQVKH